MVRPGDEVIVFEPVYDSYAPAIELNGGKTVMPGSEPARLSARLGRGGAPDHAAHPHDHPQHPHNPTGTVWTGDDMRQLEALVRDTDIVLLSDGSTSMVFDQARHESVTRYAGLAERALVSSFGKTYHITGWKVAYCLAPRAS